MDDQEYTLECDVCGVTTVVIVEEDEEPLFCPMCGTEIEIGQVRYITTGILFVVFFWMWPYRLFTHKNNCYFWTLEKLISEGGSVCWYRSRLWNGFHCTWVDPDGVEWEYTMPRLRKLPWWYVPMWYEGRIRKLKKQYTYRYVVL